MKNSDNVAHARVKKAVSKGLKLETPVDLQATNIKFRATPMTVDGEVIEKTTLVVDLKLPNGHVIQAEVKGSLYENTLIDLFTEEPYISSI